MYHRCNKINDILMLAIILTVLTICTYVSFCMIIRNPPRPTIQTPPRRTHPLKMAVTRTTTPILMPITYYENDGTFQLLV